MPKIAALAWVENYKKWLPNNTAYNVIDAIGKKISSTNDDEDSDVENFENDSDFTNKVLKWHRKGGVLLIAYPMLRSRLNKFNSKEKYMLNQPDLIVLDEGHMIKNTRTQSFQIFNKINTTRRIILTGTPIINNFVEFKNLKSIFDPDYEGDDESKKFFDDVHIFHLISTHPSAILFKKYPGHKENIDLFFDQNFINKQLAPRKKINEFIDLLIKRNHVSKEDMFNIDHSNKFVILNSLLSVCMFNNQKMVIYSTNKGTLDLIEAYFKRGIFSAQNGQKWIHRNEYYRVDGDINDINTRKAYVDEFVKETNRNARVILISKVGGESIDLTGANHCVIWESDWNNSSTKQTIHRIYRYGQDKEITVYKFFSEGIEHLKYKKQLMKQCLSDRILDKKDLFCKNSKISFSNYYSDQKSEELEKENYFSIFPNAISNVFYLKQETIHGYMPEEQHLNSRFDCEVNKSRVSQVDKYLNVYGDLNNDLMLTIIHNILEQKRR